MFERIADSLRATARATWIAVVVCWILTTEVLRRVFRW
jgi:hypothetical protein